MTFFTHMISGVYQKLCDMAEEPLETAVNIIYGAADELLPQHAEEVDLNTLSEEELKQLSCSNASFGSADEKSCRDKLKSYRGFRNTNPAADHTKANKAINALRARLTLLEREKSSNNWRARVVSAPVQLLLGSMGCSGLPRKPCVCAACLQEQQKQQQQQGQQQQQQQQHMQAQQQQQQQQRAGAPQAGGALHWFTSKQLVRGNRHM
jgi:aspartate aminotransferase-like enzyme